MPTTEMRCHWCQIHFYDGSVSSDPILSLLPSLLSPPVPPPRPRRLPLPHTPIVTVSPRLPQSPPLPPLPPRCGVVGCCVEQKCSDFVKVQIGLGAFFLFTPLHVTLKPKLPPPHPPSRGRKITKKHPVCEIHEK